MSETKEALKGLKEKPSVIYELKTELDDEGDFWLCSLKCDNEHFIKLLRQVAVYKTEGKINDTERFNRYGLSQFKRFKIKQALATTISTTQYLFFECDLLENSETILKLNSDGKEALKRELRNINSFIRQVVLIAKDTDKTTHYKTRINFDDTEHNDSDE